MKCQLKRRYEAAGLVLGPVRRRGNDDSPHSLLHLHLGPEHITGCFEEWAQVDEPQSFMSMAGRFAERWGSVSTSGRDV